MHPIAPYTVAMSAALGVLLAAEAWERRELVWVAKPVAALSYLPSGTEIASVALEHAVILWDVASGAQRTTLWGAKGETFSSVAITGEEPLVVAGLADGRLRVWAPE